MTRDDDSRAPIHEERPADAPPPEERVVIETLRPEVHATPRIAVSKIEGGHRIAPEDADAGAGTERLLHALGSVDPDFLEGLLAELAEASRAGGEIDADALNFLFSIVKGVDPRDQIEALLAVQMATVHRATMRAARRLDAAAGPAEAESASVALSRLTRAFAAEVAALKRYRLGGKQKLRIDEVRAILGLARATRQRPPRRTSGSGRTVIRRTVYDLGPGLGPL